MKSKTSKRWISCVVVMTLFAACGGDSKAPSPAAPPVAPKAPLIEKTQVVDWCPEHGVPESICTRCNASLVDSFKKKGDWCTKHELPDSQCLTCHPELEAKLKAMAPKKK
jgi:hypothetical protein